MLLPAFPGCLLLSPESDRILRAGGPPSHHALLLHSVAYFLSKELEQVTSGVWANTD